MTPRYRLTKPFYVDDNYIPEGVIIEYEGRPNEAMEPLNEEARAQMREFLAANGGYTPDLADQMEAAMNERPREGVTIVNGKPQVPLMGTIKPEGAPPPKRKASTAVVVEDAVHPSAVKVPVMGSVADERSTDV